MDYIGKLAYKKFDVGGEATKMIRALRYFQEESVIGGGSILSLIDGSVYRDIDVFVNDLDKIAFYLELLVIIFPDLEIVKSSACEYDCSVVTATVSSKDIDIQFIYTEYSDPMNLIETFDMDYVH